MCPKLSESPDLDFEEGVDYEKFMKDIVCKYYDKNSINFLYVGNCHAVTNKLEPSSTNLWRIFSKFKYLPCGYLIKQNIPSTTSIYLKPISGKVLGLTVDPITFDKPKVKYNKFKKEFRKETKVTKVYNQYLEAINSEYDFIYNIKRVSPAHKLR